MVLDLGEAFIDHLYSHVLSTHIIYSVHGDCVTDYYNKFFLPKSIGRSPHLYH